MRTRTYKIGLHSLTLEEINGVITLTEDGRGPFIYTNVREAAVAVGDTVGDWITKSILAEAAFEGMDIWKGLKNEQSGTDLH